MEQLFTRRKMLAGMGALGLGALGLSAACSQPPTPSSGPAAPTPAGGAAPAPNTAPASASGGAASLQFWDMVWGPPEYIDTAKKLVDQFNQQTPSIQVTYTSVPWTNMYQTYVTAIGSGTAPDISTGAGFQAADFYGQGAILEIDDVVQELKNSGKADDFVAGSIDSLRVNGHYVTLPWQIDIRIPWYNKDLLEKAGVGPPKTWDEFAVAMQKLTSGQQYGFVSSGPEIGAQHLWEFMINNDGGLFTEDKKVNLMADRNVEALTWFSNFVKAQQISPASAGYLSDDAVKVFGQGNAAMFIHTPGFDKRFPEIKIGALEPLTGPHGTQGTVHWVNNIMIYKQTKHPDETKTFLKWWSENQKPLWTEGHQGGLVVRKSFATDPYFQNDANLKIIFDKWLPVAKTFPYHYTQLFPELNTVEGEGWAATMTTELLQGKDVQQTMKKSEDKLKTLVKS